MERALIAMSGGVDSSVAALRMMEAGYDCVGATMRLLPDAGENSRDAGAVCAALGIPHRTVELEEAFRREVICPFIEAYEAGETPNPCVTCNRTLKFGALLAEARALDCTVIATGHYARISRDGESGRYLLRKAVNGEKDQSYVLWSLTQEQLAYTRFPLGGLSKPQVREIAAGHGFVTAGKHDSQDICFVPDGDYAGFIERETGKTGVPGDFIDRQGRVLGRHRGLIRYTVGQRRGLGLSLPAPLYVAEKRPADNTVVLCPDGELFADTLHARAVNWIAFDSLTEPRRMAARIRYHHREQPATVTPLPDGRCRVDFDAPQRAVTPGQSVVFYDGELVLGGGIIC